MGKHLPCFPLKFRLDYVRRELRANGFLTDPASLLNLVVAEVAYAMWPPLHEDTQPSYGVVITDVWEEHFKRIPEVYRGTSLPCKDGEKGRTYADGETSFFVRHNGEDQLWVPTLISFSDEASLFSLRDEVLFKARNENFVSKPLKGTDFIIVQRARNGVVMVMHWGGIILMRDGAWSSRTYQYSLNVEEELARREKTMSDTMEQTIRSLLSICLHVLSPRRCGATIVAHFDEDQGLSSCLNTGNCFKSPFPMTVQEKKFHDPIAHVLAQVDGAAIISESGCLESLNNWLTPRDDNIKKVFSLGGSRQLTARATSMQIRSPVFTVSSDGPVRVFHNGDVIADTELPR